MEDKIKQSFEAISNGINTGFNSLIALSHLSKDKDMTEYIKALEQCLTKTK